MSYQEVYNGLNKKASNEQIKKLASIIGMKKKAADEKADPKEADSDNLGSLPPGNPVRQYLKPVVKNIYTTESYLPQSKEKPMAVYKSLSTQARDAVNPWGGDKTEMGARFNRLWDVFHNWKTRQFNRTGKFPTFKSVGRPMDLDSFESNKPNSIDEYHAGQINSLMNDFWNKQYPEKNNKGDVDEAWYNLYDLMRKKIKLLQKNPGKLQIPKQKYQQWYEHPEQIFLDLSENKKPSYNQQLYS